MISISSVSEQTKIFYTLSELGNDLFNQSMNCPRTLFNLSEKFSKYGQVYVAEVDGNTAGLIAYYANDFVNQTAFLSMIVVSRYYQGKGIGQRLLEAMMRDSIISGMNAIRLEVNLQNANAIHFYEKNGFYFEENEKSTTGHMIKTLVV